MDLAKLSIKRPIFITCVVFLILVGGLLSMSRLSVDLFPEVTFPIITVTTPYRGAGPPEIETLVSKPLEDEISTLSGVKRIRSISQDGTSTVVVEFQFEVNINFAEQQVRDRVGAARYKLPKGIDEPIIRRIDPSDQPILQLGLSSSLPDGELYDLANEVIRPQIEQVNQVGLVEIRGGRKREIHVALDRSRLKSYQISAAQIAGRIGASGENVPAGKVEGSRNETIVRTMAEFKSLSDIERIIVNFFGNDVPVKVSQLGKVVDTLEDRRSETFVNGEKSVFINVYRQSGANTIRVADGVLERIRKITDQFEQKKTPAKISVIRDGSAWIRWNIVDVQESIFIGIFLAVIVVYFFLGNMRSTIITGLALPNSLIGAFILMSVAGFSINVMTLLALSLSVGLLIDDAIVVRENIFRNLEKGLSPIEAAIVGTGEVRLAVIATTLVVLATFSPVGFIGGIVGQFLKPFAFTVCFAMLISLFDALTIAPMLSAYFAGREGGESRFLLGRFIQRALQKFDLFQRLLERTYKKFLEWSLGRPWSILGASLVVFVLLMSTGRFVPKTFLPPQDGGEFSVKLDMEPGTSLEAMSQGAKEVEKVVRSYSEVDVTALTVGGRDGEANKAEIYVGLVPRKQRGINTIAMKQKLRDRLVEFSSLNPKVVDFDAVGGGLRPFTVNIVGQDPKELEDFAMKVYERLKIHPDLKDADIDYRAGKPEFRVNLDLNKMEELGLAPRSVGDELRIHLDGITAAKYREKGVEYDVRVRLQEDQRNLEADFAKTFVPNINYSLVPLSAVAAGARTTGPNKITRQDRSRYIEISADVAPGGGMGKVMSDMTAWFANDLPMPKGMSYSFVGQAEDFKQMGVSMAIAFSLGIIFIYLVLASLYESFVLPFTIMLALPLAVCGSIMGLWIGGESINIFSLLGIVMLLGVACKNSILLVDHAHKRITDDGISMHDAIVDAGLTRLRPILMTTFALIAGALPIAIGLNEASKQRTSMGVAIIGGLVSSTLLTLVVVPVAFIITERFRIKGLSLWNRMRQSHSN